MGAGPLRLAPADAEEITPASPYPQEVKTSFELYRRLSTRVRECGDFPIIYSGHCGASIGAIAGLGADDLAVLWFDAHGDYNTPERTESGFLDGMCLAVATGRCWHTLASTIPHFTPLDPRRVIHVGARAFSPGEREALLADGVRIGPSFDGIDAKRILVHVDLDVIDSRYGRANQYACEGGLSPDDVLRIIAEAREHFALAGLVVASYDPSCDEEGRIEAAARAIVRSIA